MAEADPPKAFVIPTPSSTLDECHLLRSRFIDAFAKLESEFAKTGTALGIDPKLSAAFGQRLGKLESGPEKEPRLKKILKLKPELVELTSLRAKVVHSQVKLMQEVGSPE